MGSYYNSFYARTFPYRDLKVVAPFWTDSTTYYYSRHYRYYYYYYYYYYYNYFNSRVYYQIYTNGKSQYGKDSSALFKRVNQFISSKKNVRPFKARWILKVTWYNLLRSYSTEVLLNAASEILCLNDLFEVTIISANERIPVMQVENLLS